MIAPYHAGAGITLYAGDAYDVLSNLPSDSVACVVTSPPYWGLRDYGTLTWSGGDPACSHRHTATSEPNGADRAQTTCQRCRAVQADRQYGHESTPAGYISTLRRVFGQIARVLDPDGTVWLNLGDSYSTGRPRRTGDSHWTGGLRGQVSTARRRASVHAAKIDSTGPIPAKNLIGMPWRVAFALQADGWIIRNCIVWHKPNAMPESVRDRLSTRYELIFLLVRSRRYFFDLDAIREPLTSRDVVNIIGGSRKGRSGGVGANARRRGMNVYRTKYADTAAFTKPPGAAIRPGGRRHASAHQAGRNPGDVWRLPTRPLRDAHFAAFPIDIPLRCIAAGARPGGIVLDPFSGAATTGLAARELDHPFIGIDLNPAFHDIGLRRLARRTRTTATRSGRPVVDAHDDRGQVDATSTGAEEHQQGGGGFHRQPRSNNTIDMPAGPQERR